MSAAAARRTIALTRGVSAAVARCELTHLERQPIDYRRAAEQHLEYEGLLASLGCELLRLPALPEHPDCVFVEDCAVVVEELAVIARPGAAARRGEVAAVEAALAPHRELRRIEAPGTLDGGDVLRVGRRVFVGVTPRSDQSGRRQLRRALEPQGYGVAEVAVEGCLHLKTAVTAVADGTLLLNPRWVRREAFAGYRLIEVDEGEPFAANALSVGGVVVFPAAHPRTAERLAAQGLALRLVAADELAKAEGGVTCCSVLFTVEAGQ